ncbi:MAG: hypothetical protein ABSF35_10610 [Polyangia bacterium]|jgi:hypothetical protein
MKKPVPFILCLAFSIAFRASPAVSWAAPRVVALLPPTGDNVAPTILQASRDLLKDHLQRTGAYTVVEPTATPSTEEPTPAQAAKQATALGAEQAIVLRLIHFGTSARVRLTAYAASTGQVVYWDSIVISGGPEELDTVIQRLVHAMLIGKPVRDSAEIDTVTDKETNNLARRTANKSFGLHLFTYLPFNTAGGSMTALPGGGLFWLYDARSWMADVAVDVGVADSHGSYAASIGGYYPLLREDFTPYLGGVVRWAYMNLGGQGASGIALQPTVGVLLGRLSSVQLRAEVGYFINTFGERENYPMDVTSPTAEPPKHYSHGFMLNVGLGF